MATATTMTNGRLKTERKARGFKGLTCPCCGESTPELTLSLTDLVTIHCDSCGDDYSVHTAIRMLTLRLETYRRLAAWIELAGDVTADDEIE